MARSLRKKIPNSKSGLYFILFIVVVGLILVYYFSNTSESSNYTNENSNNNINSVETNNFSTNSIDKEKNNEGVGGPGEEEETDVVEDLPEEVEIGFLADYTEISSGDIPTYNFGSGNSLSVMDESDESLVRNSISIRSEESISVAGKVGVKLTGGSSKDGSEISVVLVNYNSQMYYFKGSNSFLDNLESYIEFY